MVHASDRGPGCPGESQSHLPSSPGFPRQLRVHRCVSGEGIIVAHSGVRVGQLTGVDIETNVFNQRSVCHCIFQVTTGGEVWLGCLEAGLICSASYDNPHGFGACVDCRHDPGQTNVRGRVGVGRAAYDGTSVHYHRFDVDQCTKLTGGGNQLSEWQIERIFEFLFFVATALKYGRRVLVNCTFAAWVNAIASLLQYGPAFNYMFEYSKQRLLFPILGRRVSTYRKSYEQQI